MDFQARNSDDNQIFCGKTEKSLLKEIKEGLLILWDLVDYDFLGFFFFISSPIILLAVNEATILFNMSLPA